MTKHALIMTSDFGVEEPELLSPRDALTRAGIDVTVASTSGGTIQTVKGDKEPASIVQADTATGAVNADDYDLVVIPGGTVNADHVRMDKEYTENRSGLRGKPPPRWNNLSRAMAA